MLATTNFSRQLKNERIGIMRYSNTKISRLVFLIALTLIIEMVGLPQPVTGPLVNMMLILTTLIISPLAGVVLGAVTPIAAVLRGQLPPLLIPLAPFIVFGNAIFVLLFAMLFRISTVRRRIQQPLFSTRSWISLVAAAAAKILWLYSAVRLVLPLLIGKSAPPAILALMSAPQFFTAVIGGGFAFLLFNILRRHFHLN